VFEVCRCVVVNSVVIGTLSSAIDNFLALWVFTAALVYLIPNGHNVMSMWLKLQGDPDPTNVLVAINKLPVLKYIALVSSYTLRITGASHARAATSLLTLVHLRTLHLVAHALPSCPEWCA
jgi:hypothetical protein